MPNATPSGPTDLAAEMAEFDWSSGSLESLLPIVPEKPYLMFQAPADETPNDRKLRMLEQVRRSCMACSMCELGRKSVKRDYVERDPHVFSSMTVSRVVVVGQNPGWNEVREFQPFVGEAGRNFNAEVEAHGLTRGDFYICNVVRCHTDGNERPTQHHITRCRPFLDIEINLLRPRLVVALGAVAFEALCPGAGFTAALGTVTVSARYEDVPVFAAYHPSPRNLEDPGRLAAFRRQMAVVCAVVKRLDRL